MASNSSGEAGGALRGRAEIALIGCNHRTAPLELRERVAFTPEQALRAAKELCDSGAIEEAVVVSTCNRSELYGAGEELGDSLPNTLASYFSEFHKLPLGELNGRIYQHAGGDAARHLFRVASGLDSMMLGEAEILGQVRDAYKRAAGNGSTGPVLHRLFQSALEVGKRVRTETEIGARPVSVALAGVKLAERIFGDLDGHRALIIGAGTVAEQVVESLRARGIEELELVNRSFARAEELAHRMGGKALPWGDLETALVKPDIVVVSISGAVQALTLSMMERAMLARSGRAVCVIDLSVPRGVEPEVQGIYNVYLFNIDDLGEIVEQNKKAREAEIPRVEAIVAEHVSKFLAWQSSLEGAVLIQTLRARLEAERQSLLSSHFEGSRGIPEADRERFNHLTQQLIDRIVDLPAAHLRRERKLRRPVEGLAALRELFGLADSEGKEKP